MSSLQACVALKASAAACAAASSKFKIRGAQTGGTWACPTSRSEPAALGTQKLQEARCRHQRANTSRGEHAWSCASFSSVFRSMKTGLLFQSQTSLFCQCHPEPRKPEAKKGRKPGRQEGPPRLLQKPPQSQKKSEEQAERARSRERPGFACWAP